MGEASQLVVEDQPGAHQQVYELKVRVSGEFRTSHDRDLDVVDRGQGIEQAVPLLAALPSDPELTGRRSEVKRGRLEPVDIHRVALDGEVALLLR